MSDFLFPVHFYIVWRAVGRPFWWRFVLFGVRSSGSTTLAAATDKSIDPELPCATLEPSPRVPKCVAGARIFLYIYIRERDGKTAVNCRGSEFDQV